MSVLPLRFAAASDHRVKCFGAAHLRSMRQAMSVVIIVATNNHIEDGPNIFVRLVRQYNFMHENGEQASEFIDLSSKRVRIVRASSWRIVQLRTKRNVVARAKSETTNVGVQKSIQEGVKVRPVYSSIQLACTNYKLLLPSVCSVSFFTSDIIFRSGCRVNLNVPGGVWSPIGPCLQ